MEAAAAKAPPRSSESLVISPFSRFQLGPECPNCHSKKSSVFRCSCTNVHLFDSFRINSLSQNNDFSWAKNKAEKRFIHVKNWRNTPQCCQGAFSPPSGLCPCFPLSGSQHMTSLMTLWGQDRFEDVAKPEYPQTSCENIWRIHMVRILIRVVDRGCTDTFRKFKRSGNPVPVWMI